ncbi:NERD domain-containing protein kinase family protein [Actinotalea sp. K2]|uniref:protein kinase domain-containing protein n=1 Tax=Actinotalea sp. K2 TaxID=2939438 RepID=UPI002016CEBD|nr:NERD domain-containing protein kinase family protein [Actinotalea sp. K2]MCL3862943.1 NERD domain-containing serine/threonine-protein kinase [Actinotalea sp. K2]
MATLELLGEYEGPGEQKTAERLAAELPARWLILAGRKLPGENRDDVDLIVIGEHRVFVLEEKAWGPRVVVDDNRWLVGDDWRINPLNRNGQLARKVAGLLRDRVRGYKDLRGRHVLSGVVLSHDRLALVQGAHHDPSERIYPLAIAAAEIARLDREEPEGIHRVRDGVIGFLRGMPPVGARAHSLGDYTITGRIEVPGTALGYTAETGAGHEVVLKCYRTAELAEHGDPRLFLERETRALNRLADLNRTWRPLPFFSSDEHGLFVVPVVPPLERRSLAASVREADPARPEGHLEREVARRVTADAFSALAEVHGLGLVHRALHPTRVWLGRGLRVIFSDFHLARIAGDVSVALWAPDFDVSEDYRAPECATNVALALPASDVFSLALCLATWLLGAEATDLSHDQLSEALGREWSWAGDLVAALHPDPAQRPTAEELGERLTAPVVVVPPSREPIDIEEGALIDDRYEVKRSLGAGGFAQTWLVYDRRTEQSKVLKAFLRDLPAEAMREYRAAEKLRHERCARVYDVQADTSPHYLVSEYIEGVNLADVQPVPEVDQLRGIASDALEALAYIHGKEQVHGDITPTNVIVDASMRATLIDFGLSVHRGDPLAGWHPRFCAPEVRAGGGASASADLFGLGASLIYLMLGRDAVSVPGSGAARLQPPTAAERELWGPRGAALLDALFAAVALDPMSRPATAQDLLEAVRTTLLPDPPPSMDEFKVNPTVDSLRRLYRASSAGNAGNRGLDDEFAKTTYVPTLLDSELTPRILEGDLSVVLLTGNPGDGKTSFLVRLGEHLKGRGAVSRRWDEAGYHLELDGRSFRAVFDASESHGAQSSDDLVLEALAPAAACPETEVALIAVNDGRLRQFFDAHEGDLEEMALAVRAELDGRASLDARVAVVDLKRRSLAGRPAAPGLGQRTLAELTRPELWAACGECRARTACPIYANQALLSGVGAEAFAELVLTSHLRRRRRATFRDLRSAAAFSLTGDRACTDVHEVVASGRDARLLDRARAFDLAFSVGSHDYLVDEWAQLDPGSVPAPVVDALRRQAERTDPAASYPTAATAARAAFFGAWQRDKVSRADLRAYRYLDEFVEMLTSVDPEPTKARILLGMSRLVGAFGFSGTGLAIRSGDANAEYSVLKVVPQQGFAIDVAMNSSRFVESVPDFLLLSHRNGPRIALTLDTAEVILRAADGEIVNDQGADSVLQEIDGFASQLSREAADAVLIVDSTGSVATATRTEGSIRLELPA